VEGQGVRQVRKWRTIWESMSFKGFWFVLGLLFGTFLLFHTQVNLRCKSSAVRFIRESDSLPIEFATTVGKYEQGSARAATLSLNWWVWIFVTSPAHRTAPDSHTATHTPTAGGKANCYKEITAAAYKRKPQPVHLAVCVYARLRTLCVCVRVCESGRKCVCVVYMFICCHWRKRSLYHIYFQELVCKCLVEPTKMRPFLLRPGPGMCDVRVCLNFESVSRAGWLNHFMGAGAYTQSSWQPNLIYRLWAYNKDSVVQLMSPHSIIPLPG